MIMVAVRRCVPTSCTASATARTTRFWFDWRRRARSTFIGVAEGTSKREPLISGNPSLLRVDVAVRRRAAVALATALPLLAGAAAGRPGQPDPAFGNHGRAIAAHP